MTTKPIENQKASKRGKAKKTYAFVETAKLTVRSPSAKLGAFLLLFICLLCILAPVIAPYGPTDMDMSMIKHGPCLQHLMGTDAMGFDIFSRLLYGGRYSLTLGILSSLLGAFLGIVIGSIAGYFGGIVETLIMRFMDIWSSLPSLLLCILISTTLGKGFFNTVLALTVSSIPQSVRMIRGQILAERSNEYVEAAESINCSKISIMFKHLLPNVISPLIVVVTMGIGTTIMMSSSLSFIGLGVQPPTAEWGAMLADSRSHILKSPYMMMFPGLFIAFTVLAINLLGDGLRDALDPKLRN